MRKLVTYCEFNKFDNEATVQLRIIEGCHSTGFRNENTERNTNHGAFRSQGHLTCHPNGNWKSAYDGTSSLHGWGLHRQDRLPQPLKEKHRWTCSRCGLADPHVGTCPAMGHKCGQYNSDNHFASVCLGGHIKAERGCTARPHVGVSRQARHMDEQIAALLLTLMPPVHVTQTNVYISCQTSQHKSAHLKTSN
ncbi:hypothetical protein NDU88_005353 [Pleurodeles waltl]|uniref:Uncharacterized protein n=1 Tax=Pleurodeles waltl TaxID=8319 RepID=A0AAV7TAR9_PLEWA|nr:hypothetical protein NDU88_005353 [Pleurodeles waltl]